MFIEFICVSVNTADVTILYINSSKQIAAESVCNTFLCDLTMQLLCSVDQTLRLCGEYLCSNCKARFKKETPAQLFFCKVCKSFKNTYLIEHLQAAASEYCLANIIQE